MTKKFFSLSLALIALSLTACSTASGPAFTPTPTAGGKSQIVVYHGGGTRAVEVGINDTAHCILPPNGYLRHYVKPNERSTVTAKGQRDSVGVAHTFIPRSGETHYLRVYQDAGASIVTGFFPPAGFTIPFFKIMDGTEAGALRTKEGC